MARPGSGPAARHLPPPPPPRRPPVALGQAHGRRASLRGGAARSSQGQSSWPPPPSRSNLHAPPRAGLRPLPALGCRRRRPAPPGTVHGAESGREEEPGVRAARGAPRSPAPAARAPPEPGECRVRGSRVVPGCSPPGWACPLRAKERLAGCGEGVRPRAAPSVLNK